MLGCVMRGLHLGPDPTLVQVHGTRLRDQVRGHAIRPDTHRHTVLQHFQDGRDTQAVVHVGFRVVHQHGIGGAQQVHLP